MNETTYWYYEGVSFRVALMPDGTWEILHAAPATPTYETVEDARRAASKLAAAIRGAVDA